MELELNLPPQLILASEHLSRKPSKQFNHNFGSTSFGQHPTSMTVEVGRVLLWLFSARKKLDSLQLRCDTDFSTKKTENLAEGTIAWSGPTSTLKQKGNIFAPV